MLTYIDFKNDKIIALRIEGNVSDNGYEELARFTASGKDNHGLRLYIEMAVDDATHTEAISFLEEILFSFRQVTGIEKIAIVSHDGMIKTITRAGNLVISGEIRFFSFREADSAHQWIEQVN